MDKERLRRNDTKKLINLLCLLTLEQRPELICCGQSLADTPVSDCAPSVPGFAPYGITFRLRQLVHLRQLPASQTQGGAGGRGSEGML